MSLEQLDSLSGTVAAVALVATVIYASIQIRHNTRAVLASVFQEVGSSFAEISLEISKDKTLVALYRRGGQEFASLDELDRLQYRLLLLSLLRRAENVFFQTEIHMLHLDHWSGVRNSINAIVASQGARSCWNEIKTRFNPTFATFMDSLIAQDPLNTQDPPAGRAPLIAQDPKTGPVHLAETITDEPAE